MSEEHAPRLAREGLGDSAGTSDGQPSIAQRLDVLEQRLHRVWEQVATSSQPHVIPADPALAVIGLAVEDLHAAAGEVATAAQTVDAERRRYQEMFELAPNGYLVTDTDGTISEANRAAGELLHSDPHALIGETLASFVGADQRDRLDEMKQRCEHDASPVPSDDLNFAIDGEVISASVRCGTARDAGGRVIGYRWVILNITERMEREAMIREELSRDREHLQAAAARSEQLDAAKSQFLNLASHELRSPLAIINGYLAMLEAGTFGELDDSVARVVSLLTSKAHEMNALVDDLLEAARMEAGQSTLSYVAVDLNEMVRQVVEQWRPLVRPGQRITFRAAGERVLVHADRARTRSIVVNLVSNAIKYSADGTEIICSVSRDNDQAHVTVEDHGVGMSPDEQATLFTRFGRVITPSTSHITGTGLGLYIARELARMHGGEITVQSTPGVGSRFTITLPAEPAGVLNR